jgi:hypothetical protein
MVRKLFEPLDKIVCQSVAGCGMKLSKNNAANPAIGGNFV